MTLRGCFDQLAIEFYKSLIFTLYNVGVSVDKFSLRVIVKGKTQMK